MTTTFVRPGVLNVVSTSSRIRGIGIGIGNAGRGGDIIAACGVNVRPPSCPPPPPATACCHILASLGSCGGSIVAVAVNGAGGGVNGFFAEPLLLDLHLPAERAG